MHRIHEELVNIVLLIIICGKVYIRQKWQNLMAASVCGFMMAPICIMIFPSDRDKKQALERILEWTKRQDALRFYGLLRDEVELLENGIREFIITPERDIYDYIYETERLTTLAGKNCMESVATFTVLRKIMTGDMSRWDRIIGRLVCR